MKFYTVFSFCFSTLAPEPVRPSTRLNSHFVGGKSSLVAGGVAADASEIPLSTGRRVAKANLSNESHFSLAHDATPKLEELHLSKRPGNNSAVEDNLARCIF
jgi:hypothetical protein